MRGKQWFWLFWLLVLPISSLRAETQIIRFHDENNAFVTKADGSMVTAHELRLELPITITGKEGGQYLFTGPGGEEYRVYVPEVVTNHSSKPIIHCDQSTATASAVFPDDYRSATARGVDKGCK